MLFEKAIWARCHAQGLAKTRLCSSLIEIWHTYNLAVITRKILVESCESAWKWPWGLKVVEGTFIHYWLIAKAKNKTKKKNMQRKKRKSMWSECSIDHPIYPGYHILEFIINYKLFGLESYSSLSSVSFNMTTKDLKGSKTLIIHWWPELGKSNVYIHKLITTIKSSIFTPCKTGSPFLSLVEPKVVSLP